MLQSQGYGTISEIKAPGSLNKPEDKAKASCPIMQN